MQFRHMCPSTTCIYLDNNATTQPAPEVVEAMLPFYTERWGNPSSLHRFGRNVALALDEARRQVADFLGAKRPSTIVFTGSGTESDNLALFGLVKSQPENRHIITTAVEHSAVINACRSFEERGYDVTYLPVAKDGTLEVSAVEAAIRPDTACAAIMWSNNETGVTFPIEAIAELCNARGVPLHVDAVQAASKMPINVDRVPVSTLAISGHKIHAPKGVGALYVRRGTPFCSMMYGGGQEHGRRSGTENVPHIVGLGVAAALAHEHLAEVEGTVKTLRNRLESELLRTISDASINGHRTNRVPNTTNLSIAGVDGEGLILGLCDAGVAASTGSACSQGSTEPSHVLTAMGLTGRGSGGSLRLSLSRYSTAEDIDQALHIIPNVITTRRKLTVR
jgi:cysteine desulfurase